MNKRLHDFRTFIDLKGDKHVKEILTDVISTKLFILKLQISIAGWAVHWSFIHPAVSRLGFVSLYLYFVDYCRNINHHRYMLQDI